MERRIAILLAAQSSLLGLIDKNVRAISCGWDENNINIIYFVDNPINDKDVEIFRDVETEMYSHFNDETITVTGKVVNGEEMIQIDSKSVLVFKRFE